MTTFLALQAIHTVSMQYFIHSISPQKKATFVLKIPKLFL